MNFRACNFQKRKTGDLHWSTVAGVFHKWITDNGEVVGIIELESGDIELVPAELISFVVPTKRWLLDKE